MFTIKKGNHHTVLKRTSSFHPIYSIFSVLESFNVFRTLCKRSFFLQVTFKNQDFIPQAAKSAWMLIIFWICIITVEVKSWNEIYEIQGLIAQLIQHCPDIAEVMSSNPVQAWILFFMLSFRSWDGHSFIHSFTRSSNIWIHIFHFRNVLPWQTFRFGTSLISLKKIDRGIH